MAANNISRKKRRADSQSGPALKKLHVDKSLNTKSKTVNKENSKKRSRPITSVEPIINDDLSEATSEDDGSMLNDAAKQWLGGDVDGDMDEDDEFPIDDAMVEESPPVAPKDPNGILSCIYLAVYTNYPSFSRISQGPESSSRTTSCCKTSLRLAQSSKGRMESIAAKGHPNR